MTTIAQQIANHIGADNVLTPEAIPTDLNTALGAASQTVPEAIAYPNTVEELADVVACAATNRWVMMPFGSGSKLAWGGQANQSQLAISTAKLNRVIEHAAGDLTVTAEAGVRFADLQAQLATERQFLAIAPHYAAQATLGGIVSTANTGSIRQRYGGIRDMLIGISFVRWDGQIAKAGGRVVKNVAGYDLMKLLTGAYGSLGIITQLTFRLYPMPDASATVVITGNSDAIADLTQQVLLSSLTPIALDLLSANTAQTLDLETETALLAQFQTIPDSIEQQTTQLLELAKQYGLTGDRLTNAPEQNLWQRLAEQLDGRPNSGAIACKMGVLPNQAISTLDVINQTCPTNISIIHAASGIGWWRCPGCQPAAVQTVRSHCDTHGGYLTLLDAPAEVKQSLDVWGYSGNALEVMRSIKTQFDPHNLLNPGRFVGGL
jgi:glycolate oxidase FAD binding subunit